MRDFPTPPKDKVPRQSWDRAPWNRWSFQNIRQILPTAKVRRDPGEPSLLRRNTMELESLQFTPDTSAPITVNDWLENSYTDGFIVLHNGLIIFEKYLNGMSERTLHLSQSMAKSIVGSIAGIAIGKGLLDPDEQLTSYLPELESTAWNGATLQQSMDMSTGVRYIEDYEALDSDIAVTDIASGWKLPHSGIAAPTCIWEQILTLTKTVRAHGELFQYRSIETDVIAHCLERVTGMRLPELVSRELWQPLGCEYDAYFTVDSAGYALADGGFNATLRDYARFGQMLLRHGRANDGQIVPAEWIEDIHNANAFLFKEPYTQITPNGAYRNQFWIEDVAKKAFMARGVFGQLIYIDPDHSMVVVKLSSWPEFTSVARLKTTLNAIHAIAGHLSPP